MNEEENLELLDSENVETTTTEEIVGEQEKETPAEKTFTQSQVDEMMRKRAARTEAKIRKEYDRKYGELESVLKAGTGKQNVEELTGTFRGFYESKGIKMPTQPTFSDRDAEVLARAEADDIINSGFEEVVEEVDRLASIGVERMNTRERALFKTLAEYRKNAERGQELSKIGVKEDVYNSEDFQAFASKFNSNVPITEVFEMYAKQTKNANIEKIGSMKNGNHMEEKAYYTPEEVDRLTEKDYDNPEVMKRVRESMKHWK